MILRLRAGLAAIVALLLVACGEGKDDLQTYIERINARPGQELEPVPEPRDYEAFSYEENARRNPFVPLEPERQGQSSDALRPDANRPRQALEAFPLDALRMVGTVSVGGSRFALIRDPDNVIHRVPVGAYAGQNYGRIIAISNAQVTLVEIVPDGFGGWTERPASIPLAE